MRKILLLLMLICTAISMSAKEKSFEIEFITSTSDNSTSATTSNFKATKNISSGIDYIGAVTSIANAYPRSKSGLKFSSDSKNGNVTFTTAAYGDYKPELTVSRIELTCLKFGSDAATDAATLNVNSKGDKSAPATESVLSWDINAPISEIAITTVRRSYVRKITVYYDDGIQESYDPLGEITATVNGKDVEIMEEDGVGLADATVPAGTTLRVYCENAKTITLNGFTVEGDTFELPVEFTNGFAEYDFTISNGGDDTKEFEIDLHELGLPTVYDGETPENGLAIVASPTTVYNVQAAHADNISATKDGNPFTLGDDNTFSFTEAGSYVFTATAGEFSTTRTYNVTMSNANTPAAAVVTLNGTALTNGQTVSALLNSTVSVTCADATDIMIEGANGGDVITSNHGEFTITKPGEYTFYGLNENAPEGQQEGVKTKVTFTLTLGTPELRVDGKAVGTDITLPVGGGFVTVFAADAKGENGVTAVAYTLNGGEEEFDTENTVIITESGAYTFTGYAADMDIETTILNANITVQEPPKIYKKVTNVNDLTSGGKYVIVCESDKKVMSNKSQANYREQADITFKADGSLVPTEETLILTLDKNSDGTWIISTENYGTEKRYFQPKPSGNNLQLGNASSAANYTITFTDSEDATIGGTSGTASYYIRYNSGSPRFSQYASGQQPIQLYMLQEPAKPLGTLTVTIDDKNIEVKGSKADATVPAATTLKVQCENAKTITLNGNAVAGDTYELPIAFTESKADYTFTISNGENDNKEFTVNLLELGVPTVYEGANAETGLAIVALPTAVYTVQAGNAESISATKNGEEFTIGTDNSFSFTEAGSYVFTATAGEFSTTRTYNVTLTNANTPAAAVVTLNGTALTSDEPVSALLNSTVSVTCADAVDIVVENAAGEKVAEISSNHGEFTLAKPGAYSFYGVNEHAPADQQNGPKTTITFALTLANAELRVNGEAVADGAITLPAGGGDITVYATDAKGEQNVVTAVDYTIGEGEPQSVEGNVVTITESGDYTFTAYSAEKAVSTTLTANITVPAPQIYKRVINTDDLYAGAKVIIVNETDGYAAGTKAYNKKALELVNIGAITAGEWIYDDTKGVGVFELTSTNNNDYPYAFKLDGTDTYFYAADSNDGTGIEATTSFEDQFKFKISFDGNNAVITPAINEKRQIRFYKKQDVRTYTFSSGTAVQLYMLQEPILDLGEVVATVNGIDLTVKSGEANATVPAKNGTNASTLTVTCENAKYITFNDNRQRGDTYELPIAFEEGKQVMTYTFSITNGVDTKTLTIILKELGVPMAYVGEVPETGNTIETLAGFETFTLKAKNSTAITATKDGEEFNIGERKSDGSYEFTFTEAGEYVFTAKAGSFTTVRRYKVERANTETPLLPVMMVNGEAFAVENGGTYSVLLNSAIQVEADHATEFQATLPEETDMAHSDSGEYDFIITKPGTYTFRGINKYADEDKMEGELLTVTFTLALANATISVDGETISDEAITLHPEGSNLIFSAVDANGDNKVASVEYTIDDDESVTAVEGNNVNIAKIGTFTYHFTIFSANKAASVSIDKTITVPQAEIYKRATSAEDIHHGAKVIIVNEASGMAVGTDGSPINAVSTGSTDLTSKHRWIYDETKGVGVYVLEKQGDKYAFRLNGTNQYLYNTSSSIGTGVKEEVTPMTVTFKDNGDAQVSAENSGRMLAYYSNSSQFRSYTSQQDAQRTQLYVLAEVPQMPTLEVHGKLITDFTEPVKAHIGHEVTFTSHGADQMIVNGEEHEGDIYTMTFTEEMFADAEQVVYTVAGKNEVGESQALTVTFERQELPATPIVRIGSNNVTADEVIVKLNDVLTVTSASGTVLVYTKDDEETVLDGTSFTKTFTPDDYKLNADGTVSNAPTVYTFKARKDGLESDVVTLSVVLEEPAVIIPYRKVTSVEELQSGKRYIIACHGTFGKTNPKTVNHAMGNAYQTNNRSATALMKNSREMLEPNSNTLILTMEKDGDYWTISTDNYAAATGTPYYFRKKTAANGNLLLTTTKDDAAKFTVSFDDNGNVLLTTLKVDDQASYTIVCNASGSTYTFNQYITSNYNKEANYCAVQLYARENSDDPCAYTYAEFQDLCKKHPGREVKLVDRMTIIAHHDNMIWMKDQEGDHLFATYDAAAFAGYHMNELSGNRHFWNFSGKMTTYKGKENGPTHMVITAIDHEYEHTIDGTNAKVPHLRDIDGHLNVPRFNEEQELGWWQFGQLRGTLRIVNGAATIETSYGTYTILTDLAGTAPEGVSRRRYANDDAPNWKPGDNTFFTGTHEHENVYVSGSVMPDEDGNKALMAMGVSDEIITGVNTIGMDNPDALVDVYNMQGVRLRHNVRHADALRNLPAGLYIVNGKKVLLNR